MPFLLDQVYEKQYIVDVSINRIWVSLDLELNDFVCSNTFSHAKVIMGSHAVLVSVVRIIVIGRYLW